MRTPSRTSFHTIVGGAPRGGEARLTREELAAACGITPGRLVRLIRLGLVEPVAPGPAEFTTTTVLRLRRMLRLHADLGVNWVGASIILDLLERLERLESELARHRRRP
ncbi:MAG TPA: chaperone modulator CbpM [Candidatus Methylomirabilis sp.]|nr:chaperone modulator CbpM [Candidatus Methylomirabilis sp.]